MICHDIKAVAGKRLTMKRNNNNSWHKSCKFHNISNYTAAAIVDFTYVNRFQLTRSSLLFDQHDGSYQKCKIISQHTDIN